MLYQNNRNRKGEGIITRVKEGVVSSFVIADKSNFLCSSISGIRSSGLPTAASTLRPSDTSLLPVRARGEGRLVGFNIFLLQLCWRRCRANARRLRRLFVFEMLQAHIVAELTYFHYLISFSCKIDSCQGFTPYSTVILSPWHCI